jgi:hypothetical protein
MSIASAITAAQGRVANAYTAISAKGGTLPQTQNLANMPAAINSIPSGGGGNIPNYQIVNGVLSKKTSTYNLTGSEFSGVTSIGNYGLYYAFYNCTGLTGSVDLSSVTSIGVYGMQNAFYRTGITDLYFNSLTSSSFGSYTNQFNNMLGGVTGCTVHFPSNLQSVIGSWASVTNGFGGTNTTVLFDLPATE